MTAIDEEATETVATFDCGGKTYEVDHLGIGLESQRGVYVIYCGGETVAEFSATGSQADELPGKDDLIAMARAEVSVPGPCTTPGCEHRAGSDFPGRPGFVTGRCGHAVAGSEWRAGFRNCERCGEATS